MHELAITESLVDCVREHVTTERVLRVVIEVGRLSGVLPDALRFCFDVCAQGTSLEGAILEIIETAGRGTCRACGAERAVQELVSPCLCGSFETELLSGQELKLRIVEVE